MSTLEVSNAKQVTDSNVQEIVDKREFVTSILARLEEGPSVPPSNKVQPSTKEESSSEKGDTESATETASSSPADHDEAKKEAETEMDATAESTAVDVDASTYLPHVLPADFEPTSAYVLCGRRKGHKDFGGNWPGNLMLQQIIADKVDEYQAAGRDEQLKEEIIVSVLRQVRRGGGGFVRTSILMDDDKNTQQRWMDVGDMNARKDVVAILQLFVQARLAQKDGKPVARRSPLSVANVAKHSTTTPSPPVVKPTLTGFTIPNVPTKLRAVEDAKRQGLELEEEKTTRRRSTASIENSRLSATQKTTKLLERELWMNNNHKVPTCTITDKEKEIHSSTKRYFPAMGQDDGAAAGPLPFERPKKRRSIDENIAADALQMIAQTASNVDDDPAPNTSRTVRRRSAIKVPMARPASTPQSDKPQRDVRVCCLQLGHRRDSETPWDSAQRVLACLASVAESEKDVDLFILPELSPFGSNSETFTKYLPLSEDWQSLYTQIDESFRQSAQTLGVYIVYGMIGWHRRESDRSLRFTLQHKVVDRQGTLVAVYDKCHLSDLELKFFEAGPRRPVTFSIEGFQFGLVVGDDLKYPNLARSLARDNGVDVLVNPAAENTPRYIRQCRAVENAVYVLGVEGTQGETVAVPPDPDHKSVCMEGGEKEEEGYLLTRIQQAALDYARANFPYYRVMMTEPKGMF